MPEQTYKPGSTFQIGDVVYTRDYKHWIDPGYCLAHGWPKCCGATMTIDTPPHTEPGAGK